MDQDVVKAQEITDMHKNSLDLVETNDGLFLASGLVTHQTTLLGVITLQGHQETLQFRLTQAPPLSSHPGNALAHFS